MTEYNLRPRFIGRTARFTKDLVVLSRPVAALCAGAELLVGGHLTRQPGHPPADTAMLLREGIAIALVTAAVNVVNDIRDVDADAISRPSRPLPAGRLSASDAWLLATTQGVAALMLSVTVPAGPVVTLLLLLIGIGYSYALKGTVLAGNLVVALLAASPIVYGAWLAGARLPLALFAALIILSFMFSYEVLKTIRDVVADGTAGYRTVATQWGVHATSMVFRVSLVAYAVLAIVPIFLVSVSAYYVIFMCLGAVIPSLIAAWRFPVDRSSSAVRQVLRIMAISWIPGLIALALSFHG